MQLSRSYSQWVFLLIVVSQAVAVFGQGVPGGGNLGELSWALFPRNCSDVESDFHFSCGSLGIYHIEGALTSSNCQPIASGMSDPNAYPAPKDLPDIVQQQPYPLGGKKPKNGGGVNPFAGNYLPQENNLGPMERPGDPMEPGEEDFTVTLAAIDFANNPHGESVTDFIAEMAGDNAVVDLYGLENAPPVLGNSVGDAHVLLQLCNVLEQHSPEKRMIVNMSFGRKNAGDPTNFAECGPQATIGEFACEILRVTSELRSQDAVLVGAAGNHGELLFPASVDDVLATAAVDVQHYISTNLSESLWEGPEDFDAVLPGHALCLGGTVPLPAGTSFASAMFSGWLAAVLHGDGGDLVDPYAYQWDVDWSVPTSCWSLFFDGFSMGACNEAFDKAITGVITGGALGCWPEPDEGRTLVTANPLGTPEAQPDIPSLDEYVAETHAPAPEPDPCIPCLGGDGQSEFSQFGELTDLVVNMSATPAIAVGYELQSFYLRIDDDFYPLGLSDTDLAGIENGEIGGIVIPGFDPIVHGSSRQMSIFYVVARSQYTDCSVPGADCFWGSSPLLSYL